MVTRSDGLAWKCMWRLACGDYMASRWFLRKVLWAIRKGNGTAEHVICEVKAKIWTLKRQVASWCGPLDLSLVAGVRRDVYQHWSQEG